MISSLLELQSRRIDNPLVEQALADSQNRIRAMSMVHEHLYQADNFSDVNLKKYAQTLIKYLLYSSHISAAMVQLEIEIDPLITLSLDQAIPCGLIINELITNALKHSFNQGKLAGMISVLGTQDQHQLITLIISNQGNPLPADFNIHKTTSMGLKLVNVLSEQLNASLTCQQGDTTSFRLSFNRHY